MALPETSNPPADKKPDHHKPTPADKKEKLPTKVIVRRLPPSMDQETFLNQVSPVPPYDYLYMVKGDASLGENAFARVYINFTHANDIFDFKEKFDNYVFLDGGGHEYPAVVEFASFQKVPKRRNKNRIDHKAGSIETDPLYLEFIEMLNTPKVEQDEKPEYTYQLTTENKNDLTTPLLEYVKNKRAERLRIREERREERKRKEFERKKYRDDERKKRFDEPIKIASSKGHFAAKGSPKEKVVAEVEAKEKPEKDNVTDKHDVVVDEKGDNSKYDRTTSSSYYKNREKKYEDRRKELKSSKFTPKKEYVDKNREYKNRRDDCKEREYNQRPKYDDYKKDNETKLQQKKVKKYSEKREERRIEAQKKLEQQKASSDLSNNKTNTDVKSPGSSKISSGSLQNNPDDTKKKLPVRKDEEIYVEKEVTEKELKFVEKCDKNKDCDSHQRRIRNKDRPTIAIYRPGMLSKRKQNDGEPEVKETKKD